MTDRQGERSQGDPSAPAVSRRKLLGALAATGVTGGLTGAGTRAFLSDTSTFTDNQAAAGSLDLAVCWERPDENCQPGPGSDVSLELSGLATGDTGTASIRGLLPDDGTNNPGWVWLRTRCPLDVCDMEQAVRVTMWLDVGCDGAIGEGPVLRTVDGTAIEHLTLCEAMVALSSGALLDAARYGSAAVVPHVPGEGFCVGLSWTVDGELCHGDTALVEFRLVAEQARHVTDPSPPWTPLVCDVDCTATGHCPDCYPASFVTFCPGDGTITPSDVRFSWTTDTVTWWSSTPVETVVLYYGTHGEPGSTFENFGGGATGGTVVRGEGNRTYAGPPAGDAWTANGQSPSDPCPGEGSCGARYNFDDERWDDLCESSSGEAGIGGA
jgi:predicted ribosomally synthesized peptide with SipW-like signal peptide